MHAITVYELRSHYWWIPCTKASNAEIYVYFSGDTNYPVFSDLRRSSDVTVLEKNYYD